MKIKMIPIPFIVFGILISTAARADLVADSAKFDKAYIPALALTNQNDLSLSRAAMVQMNQAWLIFAQAHRNDFIEDNTWVAGFNEISDWINQTDRIINQGGKLADAHNALEHVREILMRLRNQHKIDYFLDYQTAFHEPMEEIVLVAKGKTPATLTAQDLANIKTMLPELESRWYAVLNAKFAPEIFGLDSAHAGKVIHLIELESRAISALKQSLAGDDQAVVILCAVAIKPPFSQLYMSFGSFSRNKD